MTELIVHSLVISFPRHLQAAGGSPNSGHALPLSSAFLDEQLLERRPGISKTAMQRVSRTRRPVIRTTFSKILSYLNRHTPSVSAQ